MSLWPEAITDTFPDPLTVTFHVPEAGFAKEKMTPVLRLMIVVPGSPAFAVLPSERTTVAVVVPLVEIVNVVMPSLTGTLYVFGVPANVSAKDARLTLFGRTTSFANWVTVPASDLCKKKSCPPESDATLI